MSKIKIWISKVFSPKKSYMNLYTQTHAINSDTNNPIPDGEYETTCGIKFKIVRS